MYKRQALIASTIASVDGLISASGAPAAGPTSSGVRKKMQCSPDGGCSDEGGTIPVSGCPGGSGWFGACGTTGHTALPCAPWACIGRRVAVTWRNFWILSPWCVEQAPRMQSSRASVRVFSARRHWFTTRLWMMLLIMTCVFADSFLQSTPCRTCLLYTSPSPRD